MSVTGASSRRLDTPDQERRPEDSAEPALRGYRRGAEAGAGERGCRGDRDRIVAVTGGYARLKINTFKTQIATDQQQLDAIDAQADQVRAQLNNSSQTERLTLGTLLLTMEQRRGTLEQDRLQARQLLALAEQVELPRVIQQGVAARQPPAARVTRSSAGLIGLIIGLFAALLWEPIAARTGRE
jgi:hypothetical protein